MPTKVLPTRADIGHLKQQAKDLLRAHKTADPAALQRIREFHPKHSDLQDAEISSATFTLADAQFTIGREYGFGSWRQLREAVAAGAGEALQLPHHERIDDVPFRQAVDLIDSGDVEGLQKHLKTHPDLHRLRVTFKGGNYFTNPSLLEFVAENPIRNGALPGNIVEIARIIIAAGAGNDPRSLNDTLGLVSSGRIAREAGAQFPLIELLCEHGADPGSAMGAALGHGEFQAAESLLTQGAKLTLPVAAATGKTEVAQALLSSADETTRHQALALAAQRGHAGIVQLLLDAGEDPDGFNPEGYHSHSTPLHQAALAGHADVVQALLKAGARTDLKDIHFGATPIGWAQHAGHKDVEALLLEGSDSS